MHLLGRSHEALSVVPAGVLKTVDTTSAKFKFCVGAIIVTKHILPKMLIMSVASYFERCAYFFTFLLQHFDTKIKDCRCVLEKSRKSQGLVGVTSQSQQCGKWRGYILN